MAPLTWLVTGCSSGFGEQFVHGILARGDRVVATGRNASSRLHHLKDTGAAILDLDVSANAEVIEKTVKEALRIYDGIDVLVNNAGYMQSCYIEELTYVSNKSGTKNYLPALQSVTDLEISLDLL